MANTQWVFHGRVTNKIGEVSIKTYSVSGELDFFEAVEKVKSKIDSLKNNVHVIVELAEKQVVTDHEKVD